MLSPGLTWPPFPLATIISISKSGFQLAKSQFEPDGDAAQASRSKSNVPER